MRILIRKRSFTLNYTFDKLTPHNFKSIFSNLDQTRKCQLLLTTPQTTQLFSQQLGQHVSPFVDQLDRGGPLGRLAVQLGILLHELRHICDVHSHKIIAVLQHIARQCVVDVHAARRVDRTHFEVAQVQSFGPLCTRDFESFVEPVQTLHNIIAELQVCKAVVV